MNFRAIHQILPTLAYADAIGNQVVEMRRRLQEWGYASEIFAEHWDARYPFCRPYPTYPQFSHPDNLLILHYSIGGMVNRFALNFPDRVVLNYHNITPARFFRACNAELAESLDEARQDLRALAGKLPAIVDSPYNGQELEALGFKVVGIVPPTLGLDNAAVVTGAASVGDFEKRATRDWLYVGRLSPNKCVHDVIRAFYYYHTWITPESRLLLVGASHGTERYLDALYRLVTQLNLDGAVAFVGQVAQTAPFYGMADVFITLSEHEGFCVPLVEAMRYDAPIVAYAATGIPGTLGAAGVRVKRKDYPVIAEVAHEMISNAELRGRLVAGQRARLAAFTPEVVSAQLRQCLDRLARS